MTDRVAVVGAGLAGLVAAGRIAAGGGTVTVFDKSRGLGGRLATRRRPHGTFDHGAPVVHCEARQVAPLAARAACLRWGELGHVGLPGMSGLVRPLAAGLDIRAEAIGRRAVEQLIWRVRNKADTFATKILIEPQLVVGGSVAAVAAD